MTDFFRDSPWLNVPKERLGEIRIERLHPRGGLLGGTSKLAALAAARKNKENQKVGDAPSTTSSVAILDKLSGAHKESKPEQRPELSARRESSDLKPSLRKYPTRKSKDLCRSSDKPPLEIPPNVPQPPPDLAPEKQPEIAPIAAPSAFAKTIFGSSNRLNDFNPQISNNYIAKRLEDLTEFDFAGPSPDDVILRAQNPNAQIRKFDEQKSKPAHANITINEISQGVKDVNLEVEKVKRKNIDVLAEFKKSKPKNAANLVVIGMSTHFIQSWYPPSD